MPADCLVADAGAGRAAAEAELVPTAAGHVQDRCAGPCSLKLRSDTALAINSAQVLRGASPDAADQRA